jgi:ClpP class serine protease
MRLDPFRPEKPEDVVWLESLQGQLHELFVSWVRERRGDKLTSQNDDLFSGEVWTGGKAVELGLVDGLGNLREVVAERFPDAEIAIAEPKRTLLTRLGLASAASFGQSPADRMLAAVEAVETRAVWSRFGL